MFAIKNIQFYTSLRAGLIKNLSRDAQNNYNELAVNDTFYLKNLKGIRNLDYYYNASDKIKGVNGENLGFDKFLHLQFKVS